MRELDYNLAGKAGTARDGRGRHQPRPPPRVRRNTRRPGGERGGGHEDSGFEGEGSLGVSEAPQRAQGRVHPQGPPPGRSTGRDAACPGGVRPRLAAADEDVISALIGGAAPPEDRRAARRRRRWCGESVLPRRGLRRRCTMVINGKAPRQSCTAMVDQLRAERRDDHPRADDGNSRSCATSSSTTLADVRELEAGEGVDPARAAPHELGPGPRQSARRTGRRRIRSRAALDRAAAASRACPQINAHSDFIQARRRSTRCVCSTCTRARKMHASGERLDTRSWRPKAECRTAGRRRTARRRARRRSRWSTSIAAVGGASDKADALRLATW